MTIENTPFEGLAVIKPRVLIDSRGSFFESWNLDEFLKNDLGVTFVQDNQSVSKANVIRGLHLQIAPMEQGKLVRVARGAVLDVAVDLRRNQATFGQHFRLVLDDKDFKMVYIPAGFAHGFKSLEDETILIYKCTKPYSMGHERVIKWNDPDLAIDWETTQPIFSAKDQDAPSLKDFLNNSSF